MCNKLHLHFLVWAAEGKSDGGFTGVTHIDLICETAEQSIKRAKKLIPNRKHYWVNQIIEHHGHENG